MSNVLVGRLSAEGRLCRGGDTQRKLGVDIVLVCRGSFILSETLIKAQGK